MRIWLVTVGEPLPLTASKDRLWRCGLLARTLASRGHDVTWWASDFDHVRKEYVPSSQRDDRVFGSVLLKYLHGVPYRTNLSLARFVNHAQIAWDFQNQSKLAATPHLIVASLPTIELAYAAVEYAKSHSVPCALDIRDLWPDIFLDAVPAIFSLPARLAVSPWFQMTKRALRGANALLAVSRGYLDWALRIAARAEGLADEVFPLAYERTAFSATDCVRIASISGLDLGRPIAIFAGSFGRTYDLGTVIAAARLLASTSAATLQFVFCGTGERGDVWRREAEGMRSVVFTGLLSATELSALLNASTIGVAAYAPGAPQSVPNKVIEYMSAGLPVVSSLIGETSGLLAEENCGFDYQAGNPGDLAAKLVRALESPDLVASMSRNSRAAFERRYSAETTFGNYARHLEGLILPVVPVGAR